MRKPFAILMSAVCLSAFLIIAPAAPGQNPNAAAKLQTLSKQLKLTPEQKAKLLPILEAEGPKLEAIKNDNTLSGLEKMSQLRAVQKENAPKLQKILTPAQYQQIQVIRQKDVQL